VRLARIINELGDELTAAGLSRDYVRTLTGYAAAVVVKKLRRSTRGARFQTTGGARVGDMFLNEGSITFSYDFFEAGIGDGPGTWRSISDNVMAAEAFAQMRQVVRDDGVMTIVFGHGEPEVWQRAGANDCEQKARIVVPAARSGGAEPFGGLAGDAGDEVEVLVVVQDGEPG
jgi:adenine-specific DNA methylase